VSTTRFPEVGRNIELASAAVAIPNRQGSATTKAGEDSPHIVRLWRDTVRVEQMARLRSLELQPGDEYGQRAWEMAFEQWRNLPDNARIDLPSPRVFGRILGMFRTGATLKTGKLLRLEISAQELAELVGYSKATVEAALRWLGSGPIDYQGAQLARGLGLIHRSRRTAWGYLEGMFRRVYRTSRSVLTHFGRLLLGLGPRDEERKREQRKQARAGRKAQPTPSIEQASEPPRRREQEHVEGQGTDDPPASNTPANEDVGKQWLEKINNALGRA